MGREHAPVVRPRVVLARGEDSVHHRRAKRLHVDERLAEPADRVALRRADEVDALGVEHLLEREEGAVLRIAVDAEEVRIPVVRADELVGADELLRQHAELDARLRGEVRVELVEGDGREMPLLVP